MSKFNKGLTRFIGCLKLQVIFCKRANNYRALLRKMSYEDKTFNSELSNKFSIDSSAVNVHVYINYSSVVIFQVHLYIDSVVIFQVHLYIDYRAELMSKFNNRVDY